MKANNKQEWQNLKEGIKVKAGYRVHTLTGRGFVLSSVKQGYPFTAMEYICLVDLSTFILIMLSCSFALECVRHYQLDDNIKNIQNME